MSSTNLIKYPKKPGEHVTHYTLVTPGRRTHYHEMESGLVAKGNLDGRRLEYLTAQEWAIVKSAAERSTVRLPGNEAKRGYPAPRHMWTSRLQRMMGDD
jgi:hypothetical protein